MRGLLTHGELESAVAEAAVELALDAEPGARTRRMRIVRREWVEH
jgi:hypothetical protein